MRRLFVALVASVVLTPLVSSAATMAELQAQIQTLLAHIQSLQAQSLQPGSTTLSCPTLARNLSRGMRGEDVRQLQRFLISQHVLAPDSATGFFGVLTEKAVQQWQAKQGIVSSGTPARTGYGSVGPKTRAAITRECAKTSEARPPEMTTPIGTYAAPGPSGGGGGTQPAPPTIPSPPSPQPPTPAAPPTPAQPPMPAIPPAPEIPTPAAPTNTFGAFSLQGVIGNTPTSTNAKTYQNLTLLMQSQGNLVLYKDFGTANQTVLWASGTGGPNGQDCKAACSASFQAEGNLVLYYKGSRPYWYDTSRSMSGNQLVLSPTAPYISIMNNGITQWSSDQSPDFILNPKSLADAGIADLLKNCWVGDAATGHFACGGPWPVGLPHATVFNFNYGQPQGPYSVLYSYASFTGNPDLVQRLKSAWNFIKSKHTAAELAACGEGTLNPRLDDANVSALMYIQAYNITLDPSALAAAQSLVDCVSTPKWMDSTFGGGAWYSDGYLRESQFGSKTYINALMALNALYLYERTNDPKYLTLATELYQWVHSHLLRQDGIYWWYYGPGSCAGGAPVCAGGTVSTVDPRYDSQITVGYGAAGFSADMAMDILGIQLFKITGDATYKNNALANAAAVMNRLTDSSGSFVDAGDASNSANYVIPWIKDVLSVPGMPKAQAQAAFTKTATSVYLNARTSDGHYGGDWAGPPHGGYWDGVQNGTFVAENIAVTSNSILMMIGNAAF